MEGYICPFVMLVEARQGKTVAATRKGAGLLVVLSKDKTILYLPSSPQAVDTDREPQQRRRASGRGGSI